MPAPFPAHPLTNSSAAAPRARPAPGTADWDIFCRVIDNHGDVGVCWRLATQLAERGLRVRLWLDEPSALRWMAPAGHPGVRVRPWDAAPGPEGLGHGVVVEAFGCELPAAVHQALARRGMAEASGQAGARRNWINLEYLSAEAYVARSHGLPSPVLHGVCQGLVKHFFYPGFSPQTGGLLREPDLLARQARFQADDWWRGQGLPVREADGELRISLFCYEPAALARCLQAWAQGGTPVRLLVTAGRAHTALQAALQALGWAANGAAGQHGALRWQQLPLLTQTDYDHLLWVCDLNLVRGEDSLVRAIWAGRPFLWQLYPQSDGAHHAKLAAFMAMAEMDGSWRRCQQVWNQDDAAAPWPAMDLARWQTQALALRQRLLAQDDLLSQLLRFTAIQR